MIDAPRIDSSKLQGMNAEELRALAGRLLAHIDATAQELSWRDAKIEKLSFEIAQLRRVRFGVKSEQLSAQQKALFEEAVDADLAALEDQLEQLKYASCKHILNDWRLPRSIVST